MNTYEAQQAGGTLGSFDIKTIWRDVRGQLWLICLLAASVSMLFFVWRARTTHSSSQITTTYSVTAKGMNNDLFSSLSLAQTTAGQFSQVINSPALRTLVMEDLGVKELKSEISSEIITETNLLVLSVTAPTPREAFLTIKSVMKHYPDISDFMVGNAIMRILVPPTVSSTSKYMPWRSLIKVFAAAFVALLALAVFLSTLKDSIRTAKDVTEKLDTKLIGQICHEKKYHSFKAALFGRRMPLLINHSAMSFRYTESVQKACKKIQNQMDQQGARSVMVTSYMENEGKSTVAANIALAFARSGKKVILVDLDLRKPTQYRFFKVTDRPLTALGRALQGKEYDQPLIGYIPSDELYFLFNTNEYNRSTEMLTNGRMAAILEYLGNQFDYIVIDTPPMGAVADAEAIASIADVSVCVVREHTAMARDINDMLDVLGDCRAKPIGCIFNDEHDSPVKNLGGYGYSKGRYGYGYHYGYGYGYGKGYGK